MEKTIENNPYLKFSELCEKCQPIARQHGKVILKTICHECKKKYWNNNAKKNYAKKRRANKYTKLPSDRQLSFRINAKIRDKYKDIKNDLELEKVAIQAEIDKINALIKRNEG